MNTEHIDHAELRREAARKAIELLGGMAPAAAKIGLPTYQHVQYWLKNGVPPRYCVKVNEMTGVPVQELRAGDWDFYWPKSN